MSDRHCTAIEAAWRAYLHGDKSFVEAFRWAWQRGWRFETSEEALTSRTRPASMKRA